ncbi:hypothetical protein CPLU01_06706 [Colletotrichum plurivorum]|uniref:Uncharacterized protein n=1 Tax=Colletotrichum plurivorum TaxID=2175906 RepID=A0A8H6KI87_9PEZI|nr:hypothetical protein CPLU01_06706 [Colletotrichum plurivorum]
MKEPATPGFATDNMVKVTKSSEPASKHKPAETASGSTVGLTEKISSDPTSKPAKEIQQANDSEDPIMKATDVKIMAELAKEPMAETSKRILTESAREAGADVNESSTDTKPEDTTEPADAPTNDLNQKAMEEHAKSPMSGIEVRATEKSENDDQSETTVDSAAVLAEGNEKESSQENNLLQLEVIKKRLPLTDEQLAIINAFGHAMQPATEETAAEAARRLDALIPPLGEEEETGDWLYRAWDLMVDLVISPDSTSHVQERLMSVLENLQQMAKGTIMIDGEEMRVWKDLPVLNEALEPCFKDPTLSAQPNAFTPESVKTWLNVTAFAARLLGAYYCCYYEEAMWVMRWVLEEEPIATPGFGECRIQAACAWIAHGSRPLLQWALDKVGHADVPRRWDVTALKDRAVKIEVNRFPAGLLYNGPEIMCLQRWGFWIERFEELGNNGPYIGDDARKAALEAAESMRMLERRIGNTLSTQ